MKKSFFQTLGNTLHESAQHSADEKADKDAQIEELQKQVANLKAQLANSSSFWETYKIKAPESLGEATGSIARHAFRVSMGVGLYYLGGFDVVDITTNLVMKK